MNRLPVPPPSDPETGWAWPQLVKPEDEAPPLRWLRPNAQPDPERNGTYTHPYSAFRSGVPLPAITVTV
jgi:hypothetical protein